MRTRGVDLGSEDIMNGTLAVPEGIEQRARASTLLDRWALRRIQRTISAAPVRFLLWDGFEIKGPGSPVGAIRFRTRAALHSWLWDAELNFGETYMAGDLEIEGDLVTILVALYRASGPARPRPWWLRETVNDTTAARQNVHHHYDLGNDFYRLWLDRQMVYTCAYFPSPDATLDDAQVAKMDLVCRKLRLEPGDRVIEAGCGWGALAMHMARTYGVSVRAFNVSREQLAYARDRAAREGLTSSIEFIEDDYRNAGGPCDAFVSVGMLEHVGTSAYPAFGLVIDRALVQRGRALLHFIGRDRPGALNAWIRQRIFPGAYVPALREVCEHVLEPYGFTVLDVENLRLHYAKTLEHWRDRFRRSERQVSAMFDDRFVRAWDLYLAGSAAAFTTGSLQLFQLVVTRGDNNAIPWTRVSG
jgi:cyclopropane-fatty-acyl-phospholipid synthase